MNLEVEIKVRIMDVKKARERVKKIGKLVKKLHQIDEYYTPVHRDFFKQEPLKEFLRIRSNGKDSRFEYHVAIYDSKCEKSHAEEYETEILNPDMMKEILKHLDFEFVVKVNKRREVYEYRNFEICVDIIKGLGNFLEIEAKKDFGGLEKTKKACKDLLKDLDVKYREVEDIGYPNLILRKNE